MPNTTQANGKAVPSYLQLVHSGEPNPAQRPWNAEEAMVWMTPGEKTAFRLYGNCLNCARFDDCLTARKLFLDGLAEAARPGNRVVPTIAKCQSTPGGWTPAKPAQSSQTSGEQQC